MEVKIFKPSSLKFKIKLWLFKVKYGCGKCEHNRFVEICYMCNNGCIKGEL